jgi:hypothetical protein
VTATKVDGQLVIETEPVESPLSTPDRPVVFTRIMRLLLEDGREFYGCADGDCDYADLKMGNVRAHLKAHRTPAAKAAATRDATFEDMTIGEVLAIAETYGALNGALERMTEDRNAWKARARKAEASLATLKKVLS